MRRVAIGVAAAALAAAALAACGGSSGDTSASVPTVSSTTGGGGAAAAGGTSTVKLEADPGGQLAYTTDSASAKAGQVTVDFNNPSSLGHNVQVEDSSGKLVGGTDTVSGGSTSATLNLKPGTYTYFCSVDGHEQAGMKGTLTVK
jgi:plastocyanin